MIVDTGGADGDQEGRRGLLKHHSIGTRGRKEAHLATIIWPTRRGKSHSCSGRLGNQDECKISLEGEGSEVGLRRLQPGWRS